MKSPSSASASEVPRATWVEAALLASKDPETASECKKGEERCR
jgi:hypothetical protein